MSNPPRKVIHLQRLRTDAQARLEAAVALVDAAGRVVRLAEKTLGEHGLTLPQFDVLSNLALRDGLTQQELAARLQVTKGNVCGLLDRLEKLGYVRRRPDDKDGRVNRLSITPAGQERIDALRPVHDAALINFVRHWTAADADEVVRIVLKLDASSAQNLSSQELP